MRSGTFLQAGGIVRVWGAELQTPPGFGPVRLGLVTGKVGRVMDGLSAGSVGIEWGYRHMWCQGGVSWWWWRLVAHVPWEAAPGVLSALTWYRDKELERNRGKMGERMVAS